MAELHTGGITTPHEWDLSVCNKAQFIFWDEFLNGMAETFVSDEADYEIHKYHEPHNGKYAEGCFPVIP